MLITTTELTNRQFTAVESTLKDSVPYDYHRQRIDCLIKTAQLQNPRLQRREYQLETAALYCTRKKNLAALSQGLGKTLIATLVAANIYDRTNRPGTIHICIPNATMLPRWLEDLSLLFAPEDILFLQPQHFGAGKLRRRDNLTKWAKVLIYTHDLVRQSVKQISDPTSNSPLQRMSDRSHTYAHYLNWSCSPSLLIIDEIHHFKDETSLKYQNLSILARSAKRILGLSGTLSEGNLNSLSAILQLVYQRDWLYYRQPDRLNSIMGSSVKLGLDYRSGESTLDKTAKQLQSIDEDRLSDYFNLIRTYVHRLSIDDPIIRPQIQLPSVEYRSLAVVMSPPQQTAYQSEIATNQSALQTLAASQTQSTTSSVKFQSLLYRAIEICNSGVDRKSDTPKSDLTLALVAEATKTAIFCQYVSSARFIYNQLAASWGTERIIRVYSNDAEFVPVHQRPQQRWKAIEAFETNPQIKAGVFSLNLAAESIDLVAADRVIVYCSPWSAAKFDQCLRRTLRPGNKHQHIDVITIYHDKAIDRYQLQLIAAKQQVGSLLLDYQALPDAAVTVDPNLLISNLF